MYVDFIVTLVLCIIIWNCWGIFCVCVSDLSVAVDMTRVLNVTLCDGVCLSRVVITNSVCYCFCAHGSVPVFVFLKSFECDLV